MVHYCRFSPLSAACLALLGTALPVMSGLSAAAAKTPAPMMQQVDIALRAAIESPARPAKARARDIYRHPEQSLLFWGLKPGATVIDVQPGSGWWTDIIAPYLAKTGGHYIAATADLADPKTDEEARQQRARFEAKYADNPAMYGSVAVTGFGPSSAPLTPAATADMVLVSRETHNWVGDGFIAKAFADIFAALKPGGVMAIEDHRARPGADPMADNGYLPEAYVIEQAKKAGFLLAARSEINANPRDTHDHPFGVWTLPPTRMSALSGKPADPAFDHRKYDAIGESDRMTLKFVKPVA